MMVQQNNYSRRHSLTTHTHKHIIITLRFVRDRCTIHTHENHWNEKISRIPGAEKNWSFHWIPFAKKSDMNEMNLADLVMDISWCGTCTLCVIEYYYFISWIQCYSATFCCTSRPGTERERESERVNEWKMIRRMRIGRCRSSQYLRTHTIT